MNILLTLARVIVHGHAHKELAVEDTRPLPWRKGHPYAGEPTAA